MRRSNSGRRWVALTVFGGIAAGLMALRLPAEEAVNPAPSAPVAIALPTQPPKGATVLFSGRPQELRENWYRRYTRDAPAWSVSADGVAPPRRTDITSRQEFGDFYLHVEFRTPVDAAGKPVGGGNSGVGLQGRYEVQILGDYGRQPGTHGAGSLYSQKAPRVNASRRPGEWQSFDIVFRAPRFDGNGQVTEKPRVTLFQNGILIQNNAEFTGMTGIQYGEYKEMAPTGPIVLQGDHDPVQFRNLWVVPL